MLLPALEMDVPVTIMTGLSTIYIYIYIYKTKLIIIYTFEVEYTIYIKTKTTSSLFYFFQLLFIIWDLSTPFYYLGPFFIQFYLLYRFAFHLTIVVQFHKIDAP